MQKFNCDNCGERIFFENTQCLSCGCLIGFVAENCTLHAMEASNTPNRWRIVRSTTATSEYKCCGNYARENVCNWMLPAGDSHELCVSCRLNEVIPDLSIDRNRVYWARIEAAKRRLIYSLLRLRLPVASKSQNFLRGLSYRFLGDSGRVNSGAEPILTGHQDGVITINIAEADDATREKMRADMGESYRTLLGHFRHEIGHFYWDRFFQDTGRQDAFRRVFGDERLDYADALARHYRDGPPANWQERYISAYAASHPWEDWAETFAHYLHLTDTLDTAASNGLVMHTADGEVQFSDPLRQPFSATHDQWHCLRFILNSLNRSMGLNDPYPFVTNPAVVAKLTFVHDWIAALRA